MEQSKLLDYVSLIEGQLASQKTLRECLLKVDAMLEVILEKDLNSCSKVILHHYLSTISDLMTPSAALYASPFSFSQTDTIYCKTSSTFGVDLLAIRKIRDPRS